MQEEPNTPPRQTISPQAKRRKLLIPLVIVAVLVLGGIVAAVYFAQRPDDKSSDQNTTVQSHRTYSLNLQPAAYEPNQPIELTFDIRDENNNVLKNFDTVHEKQMHLIVVRKDRSNFQHVHPTFDKNSGVFVMNGFTFPTDGEYRVFADFTASSAQKDEMGMKLPATPYKDVKVGSGTHTAEQITADQLKSDTDGFTSEITFPHGDSPSTTLYAKNENTFAVDIKKDGQPYKNLEEYLGALGHMVVLGPNLEFVHAHALTEDVAQQNGLIYFKVNFPEPGMYKAYLQTQAAGKVSTFDYDLTAREMPGTSKPDDQPAEDMNMDHGGH